MSKDTSGIILPFDTYGTHIDASNKTIDDELEVRNFKAAGNVLADIWSESVIDEHPVVARYIDPQDRNLNACTNCTVQQKIGKASMFLNVSTCCRS